MMNREGRRKKLKELKQQERQRKQYLSNRTKKWIKDNKVTSTNLSEEQAKDLLNFVYKSGGK